MTITCASRTALRGRRGAGATVAASMALACLLGAIPAGCAGSDRANADAPSIDEDPVASTLDTGAFRLANNDWAAMGYRWDWTVPVITASDASISQAAASPEGLVVLDERGGVSVLDPASGRRVWADRYSNDLIEFERPAIVDGRLVVISKSTIFESDLTTGVLRLEQSLPRVANTGPLVIGDTVFYGSTRGVLSMHDLAVGVELRGVGLEGAIDVEPVLVGGTVVAGASIGGTVTFLNAADGSRAVRPDRAVLDAVVGTMATDGQRLFLASRDQSVYAFDAATGARLWRLRTEHPITDDVHAVGDRVLVTLTGRGLTSIDAGTGQIVWSLHEVEGDVVTVRGNELLIAGDDRLWLVDPARGDVVASTPIPGVDRVIADAPAEGAVYLITATRHAVRMRPGR